MLDRVLSLDLAVVSQRYVLAGRLSNGQRFKVNLVCGDGNEGILADATHLEHLLGSSTSFLEVEDCRGDGDLCLGGREGDGEVLL